MFGIDDLIGGGIGLVGGLVGGYFQNKAAKQAAEIQQKAAQAASDKVGVALGEANKPIADATSSAQQYVTTGANRVLDTAGAGAGNVLNTAERSNTILAPYSDAGQTAAQYLQQGVAEGGSFNRPLQMSDFQFDPSVDWVRQQQNKQMERAAAARGGQLSGEQLKSLANYNYGLSSQEVAKAFDRAQQDTAARYSRLFGTAQLGAQTGTTMGNNLNTAAQYAGNLTTDAAKTNLGAQEYIGDTGLKGAGMIGGNIMDTAKTQADILTGGANAQAASKIAGGNAIGNAIGNTANTLSTAAIYGKYLKNPNPATTGGAMPPIVMYGR